MLQGPGRTAAKKPSANNAVINKKIIIKIKKTTHNLTQPTNTRGRTSTIKQALKSITVTHYKQHLGLGFGLPVNRLRSLQEVTLQVLIKNIILGL